MPFFLFQATDYPVATPVVNGRNVSLMFFHFLLPGATPGTMRCATMALFTSGEMISSSPCETSLCLLLCMPVRYVFLVAVDHPLDRLHFAGAHLPPLQVLYSLIELPRAHCCPDDDAVSPPLLPARRRFD